jgi:menaquinol-cytochrome c reductase iron-sulfur subunit
MAVNENESNQAPHSGRSKRGWLPTLGVALNLLVTLIAIPVIGYLSLRRGRWRRRRPTAAVEHEPSRTTHPGGSRRKFLLKIGAALNLIAAVLIGVPIIGFLFSSFRRRTQPDSWIGLGALETFPERQTKLATFRNPNSRPLDGTTADIPCWVRRTEGEQFQVFAINCTHLGCPVRWFQESRLFMCPCHGGVFYEDGSRAAGPPPRGLFEYRYKVENGHLWIEGGHLPTLAEPT